METALLVIRLILAFTAAGIFLFFITGAAYSWKEKELRATILNLILSILASVPFTALLLTVNISYTIKAITAGAAVLIIFIFLLPLKGRKYEKSVSRKRVDERDTMFSRNGLKSGTDKYSEYYAANPELEKTDNFFRDKPGLMALDSPFYDPLTFASADASFQTVDAFVKLRKGSPDREILIDSPEKLTTFLKSWGQKLGAVSVGITEMKPSHFYSHGGRGERYGKQIVNDHSYGIVFTVEMDHELISTAPKGATVMESAHEYLKSGMIATQIALTLRNLGYEATTHIDGNYDLICPIVAKDAGLGEIGRIGLLMTPELGPRIRISVVTTNAPLNPDEQIHDDSVLDFCTHCKKCTHACPSLSIPADDRRDTGSGLRWQIDQVSCFTYWCQVGTDCGRCMAVCPYSHPNNRFHNFIRKGISNNFLFRRVVILMDDIFYGKKPLSKKQPDWLG